MSVTLDANAIEALTAKTGLVEVKDAEGKVIGHFVGSLSQAEALRMHLFVTVPPESLKNLRTDGRKFTTQQVLDMLDEPEVAR